MAKRLPLILLLWLGTDLYFYQAISPFVSSGAWLWAYWLIDLLLMSGIVAVIFVRRGSPTQSTLIAWLMGLMLLAWIPRLFSFPFLLVEDITRLFRGFPPRALWVSELTLGTAAVLFFLVLFGITRGRHFYRVRRETIYFPDLPEAFDGFSITQITDVHSGSFTNGAGVQRGLDLVNAQQSEVILFTGDLVNNHASEMDRWIPAFAGLTAPMGKFSVLGNHDFESDRQTELMRMMSQEGIKVLDGSAYERDGVGFAGTKGFVGGFGRGVRIALRDRFEHRQRRQAAHTAVLVVVEHLVQ